LTGIAKAILFLMGHGFDGLNRFTRIFSFIALVYSTQSTLAGFTSYKKNPSVSVQSVKSVSHHL